MIFHSKANNILLIWPISGEEYKYIALYIYIHTIDAKIGIGNKKKKQYLMGHCVEIFKLIITNAKVVSFSNYTVWNQLVVRQQLRWMFSIFLNFHRIISLIRQNPQRHWTQKLRNSYNIDSRYGEFSHTLLLGTIKIIWYALHKYV